MENIMIDEPSNLQTDSLSPQHTITNKEELEYKKIRTRDELLQYINREESGGDLHFVDLSEFDLQNNIDLFDSQITYTVNGWTDKVIWPDKLPEGFDPKKLLEDGKKQILGIPEIHANGITGKSIKIAIIDQMLFVEHPYYEKQIKHNEICSYKFEKREDKDYHPSLVVGNAIGVAPDADIYFFASDNWLGKPGQKTTMERHNKAIQRVIEINKDLPEDSKIRFLVCSWGNSDDEFADDREKLFDEATRNGIMVIGGFYKYKLFLKPYDPRYEIPNSPLAIPTDGKTIPFYKGGFLFNRLGGTSSAYPYLAGVFALALQNNPEFVTQDNWQAKLMDIAFSTATKTKRIINPAGIVEEVDNQTKALNTVACIRPDLLSRAMATNNFNNG